MRNLITPLSLRLMALLVLVGPAGTAISAGSLGAPTNTHARQYSAGWECDHGYRSVADTCVWQC